MLILLVKYIFSHWIYKHLELNEELGLLGLLKEGDEDTTRKMIIVNLWCIQTDHQ